MKYFTAGTLLQIVFLAISGCEADRMSEKGFSLPEGIAMNATASPMKSCPRWRSRIRRLSNWAARLSG